MREGTPVLLDRDAVLLIHAEGLAMHGGAAGVRDMGLLESALAKPLNLLAYGKPDLAGLAASYAFGIVRNHPFIDGNKRTSFVAAELVLRRNGLVLTATDTEAIEMWLALASGDVTEDALAAWIGERLTPAR